MKRRTLAVVVSALLLSTVGCSSDQSTTSHTQQATEVDENARLTVAFGTQPPNLDPMLSTSSPVSELGLNVWESLLTRDSEGNYQPALAESWEISDDELTYTFYLQDDKVFHNGKALTAEDVVASMKRWSEVTIPGQQYYSGAVWKAENEHTVVLELKSPSYGVELSLSSDRNQFPAIMPAEIIESAGDDPIEEIVGTGPFEFVEMVPDQRIVYDRFDEYKPFAGEQDGRAGDRTASVAGIDFELVSDVSTRINGIRSGEYDIAPQLSLDVVSSLENIDDVTVDIYVAQMVVAFYNKSEGFFSDIEARRAVDLGLDRDAILYTVTGDDDYYVVTHELMFEGQEPWESTVGADNFNPSDTEAARERLEELGYADEPVRIIATSEYYESVEGAIVFQDQLKEMGLNATIETYDWPGLTEVRSDPSAYDVNFGVSATKDDPIIHAWNDPNFPGWTVSEELEDIRDAFQDAGTMDEALGVYDDLLEWHFDYLPISKVGDVYGAHAFTDRLDIQMREEAGIWWTAAISSD